MQRLNIESPGPEAFEELEDEYLERLGQEDWMGAPEYTVEMHLLDGLYDPMADSAMLLRDRLSDLNMYAFFGDMPAERTDRSDDYRWLDGLMKEEFGEGAVQRDVYLNSLYGSLPESYHTSRQMEEAVIRGLKPNLEVLSDLDTALRDSEEFRVDKVDLRGSSEAGDLETAYEDLQESLAFRIAFEYTGDRDAIRRFQSMSLGNEDFNGVPGNILVDGSVETDIPVAEKVGVDDSRIENWIKDVVG